MLAVRRLVALALLGLTALAAGCLSPTLPLPPPEEPDEIRQSTPGNWVVAGTCSPGAIVTVFDNRTGMGVVVEDKARSGRYAVSLPAHRCDTGFITQEVGGEVSAETSFQVMEIQEGSPTGAACQ
ncbi:MAG TPA: hypothetical protein VHB21_27215 [Minicystis sp.]|nr:hypothetical protein [Minicystis sp.]